MLANQLSTHLAGIPGVTPELIRNAGTTEIIGDVDVKYRPQVLEGYNASLRIVFQVALCMACIAVLCALPMEWLTVKKKGTGQPNAPQGEPVLEKGVVPNALGKQEVHESNPDAGAEEQTVQTAGDKR